MQCSGHATRGETGEGDTSTTNSALMGGETGEGNEKRKVEKAKIGRKKTLVVEEVRN